MHPLELLQKRWQNFFFCDISVRDAGIVWFLSMKFDPLFIRSNLHVELLLRYFSSQLLTSINTSLWSVVILLAMLLCSLICKLQILSFFLNAELLWKHALIVITEPYRKWSFSDFSCSFCCLHHCFGLGQSIFLFWNTALGFFLESFFLSVQSGSWSGGNTSLSRQL